MMMFVRSIDYVGPWPAQRNTLRAEFTRVITLLKEWRQRSRSRAELAGFDDRLLRDIGISRCEAANEISKPFWRE